MITLILLWVLYYIVHSLLAALWVKRLMKGLAPGFYPYYRLLYNLLAIAGFVLIFRYQQQLTSEIFFRSSTWLMTFASILIIAGLFLIYISFRYFSLREFIGLKKEEAGELITNGPYHIVRHPMYSGGLLILLGYFLLHPDKVSLIFCLISALYLFIGSEFEERKLIKLYGEKYKQYRKHVSRLIPFIL